MTWKPEKKVRALRTWSKMVVVKRGSVFPFFLRWRYSSSRWNFVGGIQTTFKDPDPKRILKSDFWSLDSSLDSVTVLQSFHFNFNFHILLQIMTFFSGIFLGAVEPPGGQRRDVRDAVPPRGRGGVDSCYLPFWGFRKSDFKTFRKRWDMED